MHDVSSQYPNKFNVFTEQRTYELFSKTRTERELWIEHFCKVIDKNAGKTVDFNKPSETYSKLQEAERQGRTTVKCQPKKSNIVVIEKQGYEEYKSKTLMYNRETVKGYLIKRIENRKLFHGSNFHKRFFELSFDRSLIIVKKQNGQDTEHKKIQISTLKRCIVTKQDEFITDEQRENQFLQKRSRSFLSKLRADENEIS